MRVLMKSHKQRHDNQRHQSDEAGVDDAVLASRVAGGFRLR
jgi:hypothetical protein